MTNNVGISSTVKVDISSTVLEKSINTAKEFLDKLVTPAIEEVGLLLRDSVALWRFNNQVRIVNRAKANCERNNISLRTISLKLLCPLLEGASLEEDETLQDKWAILLANMVDSDQNVQNHVFPYILGQISSNEFLFLDRVFQEKQERVRLLSEELSKFRAEKPEIVAGLSRTILDLSAQTDEEKKSIQNHWVSPTVWKLQKKKREAENELRLVQHRESHIAYRMAAPEVLPDGGLRDFELSNVIRLGLVKLVQETYASSQTLEIPNDPDKEYLHVDLEIEMESNDHHVLTELGELFVAACTEKEKA